MNLEGKKTYIILIGAVITLLAKKYGVDISGFDIDAIANDLLMVFLGLAALTRQNGVQREKILQRTVDYQRALLQKENTNVK